MRAGLCEAGRIYPARPGGPETRPTLKEEDRQIQLTLPSGDGAGTLVATLVIPSVAAPHELQASVIRVLQAFAKAWAPGLRGPRFELPNLAWSYPAKLEGLEDLAIEGQLYLQPSGGRCVAVSKSGGTALYRRVRKGWRLERVFARANALERVDDRLRILEGGDVLQVLPWPPEVSR
jgi:hypothetical protein